MEKVINFILDNWESLSGIGLAVLTLLARLYPTQKNWDIVGGTIKTLDKIIPNLKRNKDDGSITRHCVIWLLFLLPWFVVAQNNSFTKGTFSYNVTDTTFQQNNRAALQSTYGNVGNFYFDKARNKWRIWAGTCPTCLIDSAYIDLLNPGAGGGFANPMTTLGDIITGGASGTPQRLGAGSNGQALTISGGFPSWQTPTVYTSSNGITKTGNNFTLNGTLSTTTEIRTDVQDLILYTQDESGVFGILNSINQIIMGNGSTQILGTTNGFGLDGLKFNDDRGVQATGFEYTSDYTSQFVTRSLIDKGYADARLNGTTFTNSPSNGNVPTFNGTNWTFSTPAVSPAGSNTQIQFNNAGAFGASSTFRFGAVAANTLDINNGASKSVVIDNDQINVINGTSSSNLNSDVAGSPNLSISKSTQTVSLTPNGTTIELATIGGVFNITTNGTSNPTTIKQTSNNSDIFTVSEDGGTPYLQVSESGGVCIIKMANLPTSCTGLPTGTLANVAGVLNVCP